MQNYLLRKFSIDFHIKSEQCLVFDTFLVFSK